MQILTIWTKFEEFKQDSKHSNAYSSHWKGTLTIWIQIATIRTKFKAFKCKFEPFERDSKNSNANFNFSKGIRSIPLKRDSLECKLEPFEQNLKHSNANSTITWPQVSVPLNSLFEQNSNKSNANSNHSKGIQSIQMQIRTTRKGFEAFESKFKPVKRDLKRSKGIRRIPSIRMEILTLRTR